MLAANRVTGRTAFGSAMPSLGNVKSFDLDDLESDDDDAPFGGASPGNKSESIGELEEGSATAGSPPLAQWQRGVSLLDQSSNARLEQNGGQPR